MKDCARSGNTLVQGMGSPPPPRPVFPSCEPMTYGRSKVCKTIAGEILPRRINAAPRAHVWTPPRSRPDLIKMNSGGVLTCVRP